LTFDLWPWPSNSGEIFDRATFSRSEVIVRTNWQTDKQTNTVTNRRRWKHPPRFATLRR